MKLVSEIIKEETDAIPYSTLVSRAWRWYDDTYIKRIEPTREPEPDLLSITPGRIYTFSYDPITADKLRFFSYRPINLILGNKITNAGNLIPYGINLSFIPPTVRIKIMDEIFRIFGDEIIQPNIERIEAELPVITDLPLLYDVAQFILKGSGFEYAIRGYRLDRFMTTPQIISYQDWYKLNYFAIKSVQKMTVKSIYFDYMKNIDASWRIGKRYNLQTANKTIAEVNDYFSNRKYGQN